MVVEMHDELAEILEEFFTEAEENLDQLEQDMILLEALAEDGTTDAETVARLFGGLHTLKGGAGFLGLDGMAKLAHAGECLLDEVRNDRCPVSKPVMDVLLQTNDGLKELLALYKARGDDATIDNRALVAVLEQLAAQGGEPAAEAEEAEPEEGEAQAELPAERDDEPVTGPDRDQEDEAPLEGTLPVPAVREVSTRPAEGQPAKGSSRRQGTEERRAAPRREEGETLRVEGARLDKVMNLVEELVLARTTLLNFAHVRNLLEKEEEGAQLLEAMGLVCRVTQALQVSTLSTRMRPLQKIFDTIPRQVGALKAQLGKDVELVLEGEMTEVDQRLGDDVADLLAHIIRNALEHGIEGPQEREKKGKNPIGTLVVRAFYEGQNVVIQVQEDGRGIDPAKLKARAVKKGLVTQGQAEAMGEAEAIRLIMLPGFSTAEKTAGVAGRGTGMEMVNRKILDLRGILDIQSEVGAGTCFSIRLPLAQVLVSALMVGARREGFAIPIRDIAEIVRLREDGIHRVNDREVIDLRGESVPLYYLDSLTREEVPQEGGMRQPVNAVLPQEAREQKPSSAFVVVVGDGEQSMGLVVDELLGQEEVVVKPLTEMVAPRKPVFGATVTGEGKLHLIVDVPTLLKDVPAP